MNKIAELEKLKEKMEKDDALSLKKSANRLVFGVGNPDTETLLVGEGPGYWEDQKGEPFVGQSGKLLDQLLISINLDREKVYITNVVHHRPPENRDPLPEEIAAYGKYLDEIINIISPRVILTLGRFSMAKFLPSAHISSVHGRGFSINWKGREIVVVPMYHPAAALRNGEVMRQEKQDFLKLPNLLATFEKEKKALVDAKKKSEQMSLI